MNIDFSLPKQNRFEVFFDGNCPLCKREIDMIRRKDKKKQLLLTDIADPEFLLEEKSMDTLMSEIHGRFPDGTFVTGVDVFREIYSRLGFVKLVGLSNLFGIRHVLSVGYTVFAKLRLMHANRRMKKQALSGNCKQT